MKNFSIEIKWGIIFTIASLLWMILEKSAGLHDEYIDQHPIYTNLFALVAIAVFVVALNDKKKNYFNGNMTWTQGFLSGVIISIIVAILSPLAQYITFTYITPEYFQNIIRYSVENKVQSIEEAEAYFTMKNYMIIGAVGGISMGVVTSAIVAYFVKSNKTV